MALFDIGEGIEQKNRNLKIQRSSCCCCVTKLTIQLSETCH